jgi:hypothetical protein
MRPLVKDPCKSFLPSTARALSALPLKLLCGLGPSFKYLLSLFFGGQSFILHINVAVIVRFNLLVSAWRGP